MMNYNIITQARKIIMTAKETIKINQATMRAAKNDKYLSYALKDAIDGDISLIKSMNELIMKG